MFRQTPPFVFGKRAPSKDGVAVFPPPLQSHGEVSLRCQHEMAAPRRSVAALCAHHCHAPESRLNYRHLLAVLPRLCRRSPAPGRVLRCVNKHRGVDAGKRRQTVSTPLCQVLARCWPAVRNHPFSPSVSYCLTLARSTPQQHPGRGHVDIREPSTSEMREPDCTAF